MDGVGRISAKRNGTYNKFWLKIWAPPFAPGPLLSPAEDSGLLNASFPVPPPRGMFPMPTPRGILRTSRPKAIPFPSLSLSGDAGRGAGSDLCSMAPNSSLRIGTLEAEGSRSTPMSAAGAITHDHQVILPATLVPAFAPPPRHCSCSYLHGHGLLGKTLLFTIYTGGRFFFGRRDGGVKNGSLLAPVTSNKKKRLCPPSSRN